MLFDSILYLIAYCGIAELFEARSEKRCVGLFFGPELEFSCFCIYEIIICIYAEFYDLSRLDYIEYSISSSTAVAAI